MDRFVGNNLGQPLQQGDMVVHTEQEKDKAAPQAIGRGCRNLWRGPFTHAWRFLNRWTNLTFWIFVGILVGILVGYFQPEFSQEIEPLGTAFIRMIKIIVAPLIFSTLVLGIAGTALCVLGSALVSLT